jgi:MFS family permease
MEPNPPSPEFKPSPMPGEETTVNRGAVLAMVAAFLGWMFDGFEMGLHPLVARPALRELLQDEVRDRVRTYTESQVSDAAVRARVVEHLSKDGPEMYKLLTEERNALPDRAVRDGFSTAFEGPIGYWNSIMNALFLVGAAAGGMVFGWLGDRLGRTTAMMYSILAYTLFTGVGGFATAAWQLAVFRFIAALGMGGEWSLGVALIMEVWPAKYRPWLAGLIGAAANVGFLLVAVVGLTLGAKVTQEAGSWRTLMFIGVTPAFLTLLIRMFVPESHKWQQATAGAPKPRVAEVFAPGVRRHTLLAIGLSGVALLATWGAVQWQPLWVDQMNERSGAAEPLARNYVQICSSFGAIVGTLAAAIIAGRFGRRPTYFALCVLSLGCALWLYRPMWLLNAIMSPEAAAAFRLDLAYGPKFLFFVFLGGLTSAAFYGWIPLYLPELFPTRIRATGQGLGYNFGRLFAAAGNLFGTGPLIGYFGGDFADAMAAVTLIYLAGMIIIWFAPETHGKPLPE